MGKQVEIEGAVPKCLLPAEFKKSARQHEQDQNDQQLSQEQRSSEKTPVSRHLERRLKLACSASRVTVLGLEKRRPFLNFLYTLFIKALNNHETSLFVFMIICPQGYEDMENLVFLEEV